MPKSQLDAVAVMAAVIGSALALMLLPGAYMWLGSIGGLTLLFAIFSYDREGYRSFFQSVAFASAAALCLAVTAAAPFQVLSARSGGNAGNNQVATQWLPFVWVCAAVILCIVDRARMGGRVEVPETPRRSTSLHSFTPAPEPVSYRTPAEVQQPLVRTPPPARPEPEPVRAPEPMFQQSPAAPAPSVTVEPPSPTLVTHAPPPPPPPQPAATAAPIPRGGKETMIYVTLMGEGLNVLRSVRAEYLGRDFYMITDEMPEGETWQFQPGQVVRCTKKKLSSGKAMVATEEAPRA